MPFFEIPLTRLESIRIVLFGIIIRMLFARAACIRIELKITLRLKIPAFARGAYGPLFNFQF